MAQSTEAGLAAGLPDPRVFVMRVPPVFATSFSIVMPPTKVMWGEARIMW